MSTALEEPLDECVELLTEGGNDAGVDGLHMGDVDEREFPVTIFQGKYRVKDLDAQSNFPANSVQQTLDTVRVLFDPLRAVALNEKIAPVIQEVRSLIRDGYVPTVRVVLCNNGARWVPEAQTRIDEAERDYGEQLQVIHFNHDAVVHALKRGEQIDDTLALTGRAVVEDMNYMRFLVGRVAVHEVARLFDEHGDQLLQRNIRRHLGHANRVNREIKQTLLDESKSDKFYFYNNGVTMVCDRFVYNALQKSDYRVQAKNLQVVNGGQTCKTIQQTLHDNCFGAEAAFVMVRLYELPEGAEDVVREITKATNSQTPVDLRDLRSNDEIQVTLALGMDELGYTYKRQREEAPNGGDRTRVVTSMAVAEAVLAVWRERPHQAKFRRRELFGKLYDLVFEGLNAAQALLATLIYTGVEERRKTEFDDEPDFLPYASLHLAMLIGRELLQDAGLAVADVSHRNFAELAASLTEHGDRYYALALDALEAALVACYGEREVSLQQLAGTFRRGDLLEMLSPETSAI